MNLDWPLMQNNITREDLDKLIGFLQGMPRLTQSENVRAFEEEWSRWLGVRHSVFLNSGASANLLTIAALKHLFGGGEIIVPTLTWVSDITSVLIHGFEPVFVDINPRNLCMDEDEVISRLSDRTRAVFITYVQGFNGLSDRLLGELERRGVPLLEDVCESHGAVFKGRRLGGFGLASNFSFYFAHHMSTIEGGMVCTNDETFFETVRMLRSHGMTRETANPAIAAEYARKYPDLNPDFIFAYPAFNCRNTEIGAVLGRSQLQRLDSNNRQRQANLELFLQSLDKDRYFTDFDLEGSCNYAFPLVLKADDIHFRDSLEKSMAAARVEFRRGSSGGGNQMRQPYIRERFSEDDFKRYPNVEHIHRFGYYIGNYPGLSQARIRELCEFLNNVPYKK